MTKHEPHFLVCPARSDRGTRYALAGGHAVALHGQEPAPSKLISLKVPEDLLSAFKARAGMANTPYQTQIKILMREWLQKTG